MYPQLSLEQAPPLKVPVRFFLSMPLFGMLSALLLFFSPDAFSHRWLPQSLALTHLFTLGVLTMSMFGAVFQMLPVLAGSPVAHAESVSLAVHSMLCLGILTLVPGLFSNNQFMLSLAMISLAGAMFLFIAAAGRSLLRVPRMTSSIAGMRLAVLALTIAMLIGLFLLAGHTMTSVPVLRYPFTALHIGWAILGWIGLLVIAVAYQVVPMFQMTPEYANTVKKILAPVLFAVLLLWSGARLIQSGGGPTTANLLARIAEIAGICGFAFFALYTVYLQGRRRRRISNVTLNFWRLAMAMLLSALIVWCTNALIPLPQPWRESLFVLCCVLLLVGFGLSVITGMLYKILPFLVWFHLQKHASAMPHQLIRVPKMGRIIAADKMKRQFQLHLLACALVVGSVLQPEYLIRPAAIVLFISFLLLGMNLLSAWRCYTRQRRKISIVQELKNCS